MKNLIVICSLTTFIVACATTADVEKKYDKVMHNLLINDFKSKGPATVERMLNQDEIQRVCSTFENENSEKVLDAIQKSQLSTVKYPSDSTYLGSWAEGEKIAQNGRGMQSSDAVGGVNGGNCYACHRITKEEISYGNIGPSLYQYRKLHGSNEVTIKNTWAKIYNSQAFKACTNMPRFGHSGILSEKQIKDVMALLLDPSSPVNN
jgi:sulfur-oxidizing protein SoxX